jgi:hypothetical protein
MQAPENPTREPVSAPADVVYCLLCGEPLAGGSWCNKCQLPREEIERIFRAERIEEARTPCAPLLVLGLVAAAALVALGIFACAGFAR